MNRHPRAPEANAKGRHGELATGPKPLRGSPSRGRSREAPVTRKPLDRLWDAVEDRPEAVERHQSRLRQPVSALTWFHGAKRTAR